MVGITPENKIPENIPVISIAAANMPEVVWYFPRTHCGAYIIPNELWILRFYFYQHIKQKTPNNYLKYPEVYDMITAIPQ